MLLVMTLIRITMALETSESTKKKGENPGKGGGRVTCINDCGMSFLAGIIIVVLFPAGDFFLLHTMCVHKTKNGSRKKKDTNRAPLFQFFFSSLLI